MSINQKMDYNVRLWNIYLHSMACTHIGSCRRPSTLVEFHVWYLLGHATIHEISALVIWFQCISNIFIHYGDLNLLYIFSHYGYLDILYIFIHFGYSDLLYIIRGDDHTCHILYIMPIHGHCTLMYSGLLYAFAVTCIDLSLYCTDEWLVLPPRSSLLYF